MKQRNCSKNFSRMQGKHMWLNNGQMAKNLTWFLFRLLLSRNSESLLPCKDNKKANQVSYINDNPMEEHRENKAYLGYCEMEVLLWRWVGMNATGTSQCIYQYILTFQIYTYYIINNLINVLINLIILYDIYNIYIYIYIHI